MTSEVIANRQFNMMRPRVAAVPRIAGMIAVVALCSILAWSRVEAQSLKKLDVNVFPAGFILPLWVAQDKGFFAQLQVRMIATPNSVQQMTGLINGQFDIAMTAVDNVIAYMEGQGEAPTRSTPDIVALMGSSSGFLSLITAWFGAALGRSWSRGTMPSRPRTRVRVARTMPISTGKPTCQERSARTVVWRGFGKVLVARHDAQIEV